ncbi:MAG: hypothetical protein H8D63_02580 [Parcubacteria group bacterium]|nr:hypothetical protein [Parcubacteria group bacterium]
MFTIKEKRVARQQCWCCGELIAQEGVYYCPGCGTYNEPEFFEVEVAPEEYRLLIVHYLLDGVIHRAVYRNMSVEEAKSLLPEGVKVSLTLSLFRTQKKRVLSS